MRRKKGKASVCLTGTERYISVPVAEYPAEEGYLWCYNHHKKETQLLANDLASVLRHCGGLRSLEEHAERLVNKGWENGGFLKEMLDELVRLDLLRTEESVIQEARMNGGGDSAPPVTTVSVITADRPALMGRSLDSLVQNNKRHGRNPGYLILDDSSSSSYRDKNLDFIRKIAEGSNLSVGYMGMEEKQKLFSLLTDTRGDIPEHVLKFALGYLEGFERTVGANRNHFLLATAGEQALMMDDDVVCDIVHSENFHEGQKPDLCSLRDPAVISSFGSREELLSDMYPVDTGLLAAHERLLGRSAASLIDEGAVLRDINPKTADSLTRKNCRITATLPGFYGDSGMSNSRWVFTLRGRRRDEIINDSGKYDSACQSREIVRSVSRYTLSETSSMQTHQIALDNRDILPPFFPVLRNQDGLFAATLRACLPDSFVGHIPLLVGHFPDQSRFYGKESLTVFAPRMAEYLMLVLSTCLESLRGDSAENRLIMLGRRIMEIGHSGPSSFGEFLKLNWMKQMSLYNEYLENLLSFYNYSPSWWASDVQEHLESCRAFITSDPVPAPSDLGSGRTEDEAMSMCRYLVSGFGELMTFWPEIIRMSLNLRRNGLFPVRIISGQTVRSSN